jgi:hypothetical protein
MKPIGLAVLTDKPINAGKGILFAPPAALREPRERIHPEQQPKGLINRGSEREWAANAALFDLYYMHKPWMIPSIIVGSLAIIWPPGASAATGWQSSCTAWRGSSWW